MDWVVILNKKNVGFGIESDNLYAIFKNVIYRLGVVRSRLTLKFEPLLVTAIIAGALIGQP